jgi:hypothetical protein
MEIDNAYVLGLYIGALISGVTFYGWWLINKRRKEIEGK